MQTTIKRRLDVLEQLADRRPDMPIWRSPQWQAVVTILIEELSMPDRVRIADRLLKIGL